MALDAQDLISQLLFSFKGMADKFTTLKSSLIICRQAVIILESQIKNLDEEKSFNFEKHKSKLLKEERPSSEKDLISNLTSDVLFSVSDFLHYKQVVRFRRLNKSLFAGLIGCPLKFGISQYDGIDPLEDLNELSKLRINKSSISSKNSCCNCVASRFMNTMAQEFPEQLALCPLNYSKVSSKYQFSPTIPELKSIGYYQPWTISDICLKKWLSDEDIDRIVHMQHILRLNSLTMMGPRNLSTLFEILKKSSYYDHHFKFSDVSALSNLEVLAIDATESSFNIETLSSLNRLEELFVHDCPNIEGDIEALSSFHLKCLALAGSSKICGNISSLSSLDQLSKITIWKKREHSWKLVFFE